MKTNIFLIILQLGWLVACDFKTENQDSASDTTSIDSSFAASADGVQSNDTLISPADSTRKTFSNERFKDVTVKPLSQNKFEIQGKGQIFEANFGWVIEDGHNELKEGFEMTDAGAPEWGEFKFTVEAEKERPNSTLHIILFESSAKDGSRVHELMVPLY